MRTPRHRQRYVVVLAALCGAAIAVACGFEGLGTGPELGGVDSEGGVAADAQIARDDADLPLEDGGSTVLLDSAGALPEEATDASVDAGPDGSCPINAYRCPATDTCVTVCGGCTGTRFRCAATSTCVATCGTCPGRTFECAACGFDTVTPNKFTCEQTATGCYGGGSGHCDCAALGGCYSGQQVCYYVDFFTGYECRSCGESGTSGRTCVGEGDRKCNFGQNACK